ncbi:hypothetical protein EVAR_20065_1 [Eumeta japonica]|uniref:Uncharacterized protein n=1 Tax=Eumeta variegata TaxID=151549 RepID=A0A4C1UHW2_EUMVA|nr:hypothetical protein EVAR_20065_1 [Eumeta japonica]
MEAPYAETAEHPRLVPNANIEQERTLVAVLISSLVKRDILYSFSFGATSSELSTLVRYSWGLTTIVIVNPTIAPATDGYTHSPRHETISVSTATCTSVPSNLSLAAIRCAQAKTICRRAINYPQSQTTD